jgi:hypothetical protein
MLNHPPMATRRLATTISAAHRPDPLTLHLFWPDAAQPRQIVLFSHGATLSPPDYAPLLHAWTQRELAVVAPDHAGTALSPLWLARPLDMRAAAEQLPALAARHGNLASGRADAPIRLAGHSYGAHTVALLLGARPTLVESPENLALPQADAGLLLSPPGDGGPANLTPHWADRAPYLCLDLAGFRTHALMITGGRDNSPMTNRGWRWHTDMFFSSPAPSSPADLKYLAVAPTGDHYLGGIATGRGSTEPALLADIAALTADYLLRGPAWAPAPGQTHHLNITAHPGMRPLKGYQA